uniref:Structural protein n=1 Tax=Planococcus citri densovirus TaxID=159153 RepID=A0A218L3P5_9VIRU|nr:structural protein [Planococcus citri densovirus]
MSDQVVPDVPTFTALASVKGGSKDAFWQSNQNWKKELESREGHPHGHPLNPKDGFWNWYRKYQFVNNLNDKGQPRVSKKPRISKKKAEVSGYKYFDAWRKENREKLDEATVQVQFSSATIILDQAIRSTEETIRNLRLLTELLKNTTYSTVSSPNTLKQKKKYVRSPIKRIQKELKNFGTTVELENKSSRETSPILDHFLAQPDS